MKKKQLINKSNVTATIVTTMLLAIVISFITACETETQTEPNYSEAEYLELDVYNKYKMGEKEFAIIFKAIKRLEISRVNGLYKIKESTAEDLNISPKLFNYITASFDYTNSTLNPKLSSNKNKITRLKSGNYEDIYQQIDTTYCLSYAISKIGHYSLNITKSYQDSEEWGNGVMVPYNEELNQYDIYNVITFIKHFYPNTSQVNPSNLDTGFLNNQIIIYKTSNGGYHAVNATYYNSSGVFFAIDAKTDRSTSIFSSDVITVFQTQN
ncbi:hypothetical protein ACFLRU_06950 [Bacteroidota bacterium]